MKKMLFMFLGILLISSPIFAAKTTKTNASKKAEIKTVEYVFNKAENREKLVLEGTFSLQVDDDEFLFDDGTGKVVAELSKFTKIIPAVSSFSDLAGAKVRIQAIVNKKWSGRHEIKVIQIKVESMKNQTMAAVTPTTVQDVLKKAAHLETVTLEGVFSSQIDDDEFVFEDDTAKIRAELSKHTAINPAVSSFSDLDGAKVKIQAIVKKEYGEKEELEVVRIEVQELVNHDDEL